jgi:hypothetical protein
MSAPGNQTGEEFARANGFAAFSELMAASRHVPVHEGPEQFVTLCPDGHELFWSADEINDLDRDDRAIHKGAE